MKKCVQLWMVMALLLAGGVAKSQISEFSAGYVNPGLDVSKGAGRSVRGNGFNVGYMHEWDYYNGFSIKSGAYYNYLIYRDKVTISDVDFDNKLQEHTVTGVFNANYKYEFSSDFVLFAFAGPRMWINMSSKWKMKASSSLYPELNGEAEYSNRMGSMYSNITSWYFQNFEISPQYSFWDIQLGLGIGVELFGQLVVKAGMDFGLLNQYVAGSAANNIMRRNHFYVNVGYRYEW